jgi:hypothetical protein
LPQALTIACAAAHFDHQKRVLYEQVTGVKLIFLNQGLCFWC